MFEADLYEVKKGDIVGLTMFNSVHNIGFVDDVSGGMIRLHTLIGQIKMTFSQDYSHSPRDGNKPPLSPEFLNRPSAKGISIRSIVELPERIKNDLSSLDFALKGKSALQSKILITKNDSIIREALSIMRTAALKPQMELPGMRF